MYKLSLKMTPFKSARQMTTAGDFALFETLMKGFYDRNGLDFHGDDMAAAEMEIGEKRVRLFPAETAEGRLVCVVDFPTEEARAALASPDGLMTALQMNADALLAEDFRFARNGAGEPILFASFALGSLTPDDVLAIVKDAVASADLLLLVASRPSQPDAGPRDTPGLFLRA